MKWEVRAQHSFQGVELEFALEPPGSPDAGYFSGYSPRALPLLSAIAGSGIDPYPESDLAGFTDARVVWIAVRLSSHRVSGVAPRPAPAALRRTHPWLRDVRFFDQYFPARLEPRWAAVYDAHGVESDGPRARTSMFRVSVLARERPVVPS